MAPAVVTTRGAWVPAAMLAVGAALNITVQAQRTMRLAAPLSTLPDSVDGYLGREVPIDPDQFKVAGATAALQRVYLRDSADYFTVYVGYYDRQRQGRTIHSPKNCLPGAGWEPVDSRRTVLTGNDGLPPLSLNRIVIASKTERALVYYWYQGRGRTEANEYQVKLDLIRDSALRRRSEESLVRIIVPLGGDEARADQLAEQMARWLHRHLIGILPA